MIQIAKTHSFSYTDFITPLNDNHDQNWFTCRTNSSNSLIISIDSFGSYLKLTTKQTDAETSVKVLGFPVNFLVYPKYTFRDYNGKLNVTINSCPPPICNVKYKSRIYTKTSVYTGNQNCLSLFSYTLSFNEYIPYYVVDCMNYPPLYYHMINKYTQTFPINQLQYYIQRISDNNNHDFIIKFTNPKPLEICLYFYAKSYLKPRFHNYHNYKKILNVTSIKSSCGTNLNSLCYAPCMDIKLKLLEPFQNYLSVAIFDRNNYILDKSLVLNVFSGAKYDKIVHSTSGPIVKVSRNKVVLNLSIYHSISKIHEKDFRITFKTRYFYANSSPSGSMIPTCDFKTSVSATNICLLSDTDRINVQNLESGIIYKFKIFFYISNNYETMETHIIETEASHIDKPIQYKIIVSGPTVTVKLDVTTLTDNSIPNLSCRYLISISNKNEFLEPKCEKKDNNCRGLCNEEMKIIGLDLNVDYDMKIMFNTKYGHLYYKHIRKDRPHTLLVDSKLTNNQIQVSTSLIPPIEHALCAWKLHKIGMEDIIIQQSAYLNQLGRNTLPYCSHIVIDDINDDFGVFQVDVEVVGCNLSNGTIVHKDKITHIQLSHTITGNCLNINIETFPKELIVSCQWKLFEWNGHEETIIKSCKMDNMDPCYLKPCNNILITDNILQPTKTYYITIISLEFNHSITHRIASNNLKNYDPYKNSNITIDYYKGVFRISYLLSDDDILSNLKQCEWILYRIDSYNKKNVVKECYLGTTSCHSFQCDSIYLDNLNTTDLYQINIRPTNKHHFEIKKFSKTEYTNMISKKMETKYIILIVLMAIFTVSAVVLLIFYVRRRRNPFNKMDI